jgi:hypothetical protein
LILLREGDLYVVFAGLDMFLHPGHEPFIAQKHLPFEVCPRRFRIDAFRHELRVALLRQTADGDIGAPG